MRAIIENRFGVSGLTLAFLVGCHSAGPPSSSPGPALDPLPTSRAGPAPTELDQRVTRFLDERRGSWRDLNVPYEDGRVLHDLVVNGGYRSILEIGTSTGHSTVWLAWAASKTGGRVTTIEIDEDRHQTALANLAEAGLTGYVDAHLADAHELVRTLPGPFDFVFSDADKDWYVQYFEDLEPKIREGGCIAAHNALNGFEGVDRYVRHVQARSEFTTRIDRTSSSGFAISCRRPTR